MRFQFTPLREGRQIAESTPKSAERFQFTPLREGRPRRIPYRALIPLFQFTPLREGRLVAHRAGQPALGYFNSRPCVRGDFRAIRLYVRMLISIHAPA